MSNMIKKPYEISLWDDVLVFVVENNGTKVEYEQSIPEDAIGKVVAQYYKERKLCVIGSDTMESPARATAGKLISNVNGSNTLTFNLYYRYYDEDLDDMVFNPFHKLLTNERKIKLRHGALGAQDTKWYDLIIKNIQENSDNKTFSYTCKDQFCNELSKSGFDIQLDPELENNMGTIEELATVILEDSDWKLKEGASDILTQYKEEPLYAIQLKEDITAVEILDRKKSITIAKGKTIYVFYSIISNQNSDVQFLYTEETSFKKDDDYVIDKKYPNYLITGVEYIDNWPSFTQISEITNLPIAYFTDEYRGNKVVRQEKTIYDPTIDKYVKPYKKTGSTDGSQVYLYTESEYISPTIVQNYITNPYEFESEAGWSGIDATDSAIPPTAECIVLDQNGKSVPELEGNYERYFKSYIRFEALGKGQYLKNSGPKDNLSIIGSFAENGVYVFRIRFRNQSPGETNKVVDKIGNIWIGGKKINTDPIVYFTLSKNKPSDFYSKVTGLFNSHENYYVLENGTYKSVKITEFAEDVTYYTYGGWEFKLNSQGAQAYSDLIRDLNLGLYIEFAKINVAYDIEEASMFLYAEDMEGNMCVPGGDVVAGVKTKYYAYLPNPEYGSIEDVKYVYEGYEKPTTLEPYYDDTYEKVRSITATESNRFNLIQDLCETFECWPEFEIEHNPYTGEILMDEEYRQKKWLSFHEYIGKDNYSGFKYGINLKSIQRTLNSDGIVTKLIVKNNANEFARNGFCTIARAEENPSGENFILDFSYYIQHNMLNWNTVINDQYIDQNEYIGLYKKLKEFNTQRDTWIEELSGLKNDIAQYQSNVTVYETGYNSIGEELDAQETYLYDTTSFTYEDMMKYKTESSKPSGFTEEQWEKIGQWWKNEEALSAITSIAVLQQKKVSYMDYWTKYNSLLALAQDKYDWLEENLKLIAKEKSQLIYKFYKKYSRFLQEGSWINEDYIDDNLYYLDAESTLNTSAKPKVTYTINVLELSQLEEYENYRFALGDKTYIEDTEFFGWTNVSGVQTPYHEEIVVTEITYGLDQPETNTVKVQNFKTQFEDLFQRMAATTQSVEYHTGEYAKASGVVTEQGTIDANVLQNSFLNNSFILSNASEQSIVWDSSGITTTSLIKPNEIVRIVSGGVFLSNDGGSSFNTGITGSGINANYITTGQLNTSKVNIMSGSFPTFRWDSVGLNAYEYKIIDGKPANFNYAKFVRFDQYGLYGVSGASEFLPKSEDEVWDKANFALTWKGFMLKNDDGSVRITSNEDIQVIGGDKERIKIGRIDTGVYGIRISNDQGAPVMETDDKGELWLKNRLRVGTNNTSTVEIGYLDAVRAETDIHEVIHAGNGAQEFIVYEDGKMLAQGAEFHGTIFAEAGKIGNMTIGDVEDAVGGMNDLAEATRKLDIQSKLGYNFKVESGAATPSALTLEAVPAGFEIKTIQWSGSADFESWEQLGTENNYVLTYDLFKQKKLNSTYYIRAIVKDKEDKEYTDWTTIMAILDGEKGEDALTLVITSSGGNYFRNNQGSTILTARLFKAGVEIDKYETEGYVYTWSDPNHPSWSYIGKNLTVTANEVDFNRTYVCDVSKGGS